MDVRQFVVALWLVGAFTLGVCAWVFAEYRFILSTVCVLFVIGGLWTARTDINGGGGEPW